MVVPTFEKFVTPGTVSLVTCARTTPAIANAMATAPSRAWDLADSDKGIPSFLCAGHGDDAGRHHVSVGDQVRGELGIDVVCFGAGSARDHHRARAGGHLADGKVDAVLRDRIDRH